MRKHLNRLERGRVNNSKQDKYFTQHWEERRRELRNMGAKQHESKKTHKAWGEIIKDPQSKGKK